MDTISLPTSQFQTYSASLGRSRIVAIAVIVLATLVLIVLTIFASIAWTVGVPSKKGPVGVVGPSGATGSAGVQGPTGMKGQTGPVSSLPYSMTLPDGTSTLIPPWQVWEAGVSDVIYNVPNAQVPFSTQVTIVFRNPFPNLTDPSGFPPTCLLQVLNVRPQYTAVWTATIVTWIYDGSMVTGMSINLTRIDSIDSATSPGGWSTNSSDTSSALPQIQYFLMQNTLPQVQPHQSAKEEVPPLAPPTSTLFSQSFNLLKRVVSFQIDKIRTGRKGWV
jgi:hypothetical protein